MDLLFFSFSLLFHLVYFFTNFVFKSIYYLLSYLINLSIFLWSLEFHSSFSHHVLFYWIHLLSMFWIFTKFMQVISLGVNILKFIDFGGNMYWIFMWPMLWFWNMHTRNCWLNLSSLLLSSPFLFQLKGWQCCIIDPKFNTVKMSFSFLKLTFRMSIPLSAFPRNNIHYSRVDSLWQFGWCQVYNNYLLNCC